MMTSFLTMISSSADASVNMPHMTALPRWRSTAIQLMHNRNETAGCNDIYIRAFRLRTPVAFHFNSRAGLPQHRSQARIATPPPNTRPRR